MTTTLIIPHYYNDVREKNLSRIINFVRPQVDDAIIWNNDKPIAPIDGARVIQADRNLGCQGRFAAVKHVKSGTTHVLFHDNDIISRSPNFVERMLDFSTRHPGDIITVTGEYRLHAGGLKIISRGQIELVPIDSLHRILEFWDPENGKAKHDDIWLSVMAEHLGITRRFLRMSWKNLKDHVGMWRTPGFFTERDQVFQMLMDEGLPVCTTTK